jgi:hypothetical protein
LESDASKEQQQRKRDSFRGERPLQGETTVHETSKRGIISPIDPYRLVRPFETKLASPRSSAAPDRDASSRLAAVADPDAAAPPASKRRASARSAGSCCSDSFVISARRLHCTAPMHLKIESPGNAKKEKTSSHANCLSVPVTRTGLLDAFGVGSFLLRRLGTNAGERLAQPPKTEVVSHDKIARLNSHP